MPGDRPTGCFWRQFGSPPVSGKTGAVLQPIATVRRRLLSGYALSAQGFRYRCLSGGADSGSGSGSDSICRSKGPRAGRLLGHPASGESGVIDHRGIEARNFNAVGFMRPFYTTRATPKAAEFPSIKTAIRNFPVGSVSKVEDTRYNMRYSQIY